MRKHWLTVIVVALVFAGLFMYLVVYSVRVDQVAAHYRLGEVIRVVRPPLGVIGAAQSPTEASGVPVVRRAGWFFKLPWPFDRVQTFDQRIRYVDGPTAQLQMPDNNQLIPRVYATWRIADPVAFQQSLLGDEETARTQLANILGGQTQAVFGRHNLSDLVNTDPAKLLYDDIEQQIFAGVKNALATSEKAYGIEVCSLGITWIALPPDTTAAVFSRMQKERQKEADKLIQEGERIKRTKVAEAQEQRDNILADADAQAKRLRAEGEAEAAQSYEIFAQNQSLAIFLRRLEALRRMTGNAAAKQQPFTFVISTKTEPFRALEEGSELPSEGGMAFPEIPVPLGQPGGGGTGAVIAPTPPAGSAPASRGVSNTG